VCVNFKVLNEITVFDPEPMSPTAYFLSCQAVSITVPLTSVKVTVPSH